MTFANIIDSIRARRRPLSRRHVAFGMGAAGVSAYPSVLLFLFFAQRALVFPGSAEIWSKPVLAHGERIATVTTTAGRIAVEVAPATDAAGAELKNADSRPTILYFYGNGSSLASSADVIEQFRRQGLNVVAPEYPGYGLSSGEASEAGCCAAGDAAYDYALSHGASTRSLVIVGRSLGTGVAVDLASRRPAAGLVTISAFTSIPEMATREYPVIPCSFAWTLCQTHFNSEQRIGSVHCPILLIHGSDDHYVPASMSDQLARAATAPVTKLAIPGADHNDIFTVGGDVIYPAVGRFAHEYSRR